MHTEWDPYGPPGVAPVRGRSPWAVVIALVVTVGLVVAAILLPIPVFYSYNPGPVRDVMTLVDVDGASTYSSEGSLLLTTVRVDTEVTFVEWLFAQVSQTRAIVTRDQVIPEGQTLDELRKEQRNQMEESKRHALEVVFTALGLGHPTGKGARVVGTIAGFPATGVLRKGDVIVAVDGRRVQTTCDVGRGVDTHEVGEDVTITVRRDGMRRTLAIRTTSSQEDPGAPFIGVAMEEIDYSFNPEIAVDFKTGRIAGPSAGLMLALALYDQLTPDDLTNGLRIAGTGTIACDGGVGSVGGIEQKVAGAEDRGAEVFLSPKGSAAAAERVAGDIDVVAVATFAEAVEYLEGLD